MAINRDKIVSRIVNKLPGMGIQTKVNGEDSHTVKLVQAIVNEIINEIVDNGEVNVVRLEVIGQSVSGGPVTGQLKPNTGKGEIK